jgi:hypothetical protein
VDERHEWFMQWLLFQEASSRHDALAMHVTRMTKKRMVYHVACASWWVGFKTVYAWFLYKHQTNTKKLCFLQRQNILSISRVCLCACVVIRLRVHSCSSSPVRSGPLRSHGGLPLDRWRSRALCSHGGFPPDSLGTTTSPEFVAL